MLSWPSRGHGRAAEGGSGSSSWFPLCGGVLLLFACSVVRGWEDTQRGSATAVHAECSLWWPCILGLDRLTSFPYRHCTLRSGTHTGLAPTARPLPLYGSLGSPAPCQEARASCWLGQTSWLLYSRGLPPYLLQDVNHILPSLSFSLLCSVSPGVHFAFL